MAEAHNAVLGVQALADVLLGVFRLANLLPSLHGFGGAAVQRALERADSGDDVAVQVGGCACGDAGRKGGGVGAVLGVQQEVEVDGRFRVLRALRGRPE